MPPKKIPPHKTATEKNATLQNLTCTKIPLWLLKQTVLPRTWATPYDTSPVLRSGDEQRNYCAVSTKQAVIVEPTLAGNSSTI